MFTSRDLRDQIVTATDASDGTYDVDAITEEIIEKHGAVDVDTIDTAEFWDIVGKHAAPQIGSRVTVPDYMVPEDWARTGEIIDITDETVVVELDGGHRQELPADEVTPA